MLFENKMLCDIENMIMILIKQIEINQISALNYA